MKKLMNLVVVALSLLAAVLGTGARASARQFGGGGLTQVDCDGLACGGSGGSLGTDFVYKVHPNGNSITSVDISVEDGDINHYTYAGPSTWSMNMVTAARSHDIEPTEHGVVSGKAGTCPKVLRFSGPEMTQNFQVGFDYFQPEPRFHDVVWKTSDNRQTNWSFDTGDGGAVHSPLRLNVLLIVLDDIGTDKLEIFDRPHVSPESEHAHAVVPNLEDLAADGVKFMNFYVNPLCSTTRACIQTGRYAHRHGIGKLAETDYGIADCEVTLGELLKLGFTSSDLAYSTGAFGKWHVTPPEYSFPSNLVSVEHAKRNGYDRFYGTLTNTGDHYNWTKLKSGASESTTSETHAPTNQTEANAAWTADVVRRDATAWIDAAQEPFFAYVGFNPPHSLYSPPPYVTGDATPRTLLSQDTIDEVETTDPQGGYDDAEKAILYRAMIEAVDSEIGYLLADMNDAKLAKTMIIVVSDNGTPDTLVSRPQHPGPGKGFIYQMGVRVPMIVSGPLAATGECDAAAGAVDLFATIAAITGADAGVTAPDACTTPDRDSVSILPLIEDPSGSATRPALSQSFAPNGPVVDSASFDCLVSHGRAVTDGHYKYIRRLAVDIPSGCEPCTDPCDYEHKFYDLLADPEETTDLYPPSPSLQAIFDSLSDYMDQFEF